MSICGLLSSRRRCSTSQPGCVAYKRRQSRARGSCNSGSRGYSGFEPVAYQKRVDLCKISNCDLSGRLSIKGSIGVSEEFENSQEIITGNTEGECRTPSRLLERGRVDDDGASYRNHTISLSLNDLIALHRSAEMNLISWAVNEESGTVT